MPKNVMKLMKPSPVHGRNDFDLSHRVVNTINFGEIVPFLNIPTAPGGKYKIRTADLIRAIPMVTSPFMRAKQHIDIWFVPYNLLWSRFNEFMIDKDEKLSSALKERAYCPHVHLKELLDELATNHTSDTDIVGRPYLEGAYRLLDSLGYPTFKYFHGSGMEETDEDKAVNLWPLLAYNYIWYTEYRQQYYDDGKWLNSNQEPSKLYNADWLPCSSADEADFLRATNAQTYTLTAMCQMRYRTWKKDLFTGLLPSTQFGNVSSINIADSILIQNQVFTDQDINGGDSDEATFGKYLVSSYDLGRWSHAADDTDLSSGVAVSTSNQNVLADTSGRIIHDHAANVASHLGVSSSAISAGSLNILALRKAEAVQIWRENALRAGNFVEDNFEAHYGVKPQSHMHHHPVHIGSIDAPLNIGDIDSHAQISSSGANQQLADVAGKGISSLGKGSFNFQTNEFGVILGLVSMLPETEYMSTGIKRENQLLEREDYYIPEYAKIGLQPVDSSTFYFGGYESINLGYAPRDYGYKQQLDEVHLDFFNAENAEGVFRSWVSPKYDVFDALEAMTEEGALNRAMPLSCLYVNPELFDVNFSVGVDNSRQFLVNYFFSVDGIQPMPVSGMPSY